jgi:phospholipid/cholesterol/gamma-HCH transport system ATP-binding protein
LARPSQRPPGQWCAEHGVTPPPGSFGGATHIGPPTLVVLPGAGARASEASATVTEKPWPTW